MAKDVIETLEDLQDKTWQSYCYHAETRAKIFFWAAGLFITAATATNLFGMTNTLPDIKFQYILLFHGMFLVLMCLALHQQAACDFYIGLIKKLYTQTKSVKREHLSLLDIDPPFKLYREIATTQKPFIKAHSLPHMFAITVLTGIYIAMMLVVLKVVYFDANNIIHYDFASTRTSSGDEKQPNYLYIIILFVPVGGLLIHYTSAKNKMTGKLEKKADDMREAINQYIGVECASEHDLTTVAANSDVAGEEGGASGDAA